MRAPAISEERLAHFQARVIQDAIAEASAAHWLRRAEQFEAARPRRGDYPGEATPAEIAERWQHLTDQAKACRNRAAVEHMPDDLDDQVDAVIADFWQAVDPTGEGRQRILLHRAGDRGAAA